MNLEAYFSDFVPVPTITPGEYLMEPPEYEIDPKLLEAYRQKKTTITDLAILTRQSIKTIRRSLKRQLGFIWRPGRSRNITWKNIPRKMRQAYRERRITAAAIARALSRPGRPVAPHVIRAILHRPKKAEANAQAEGACGFASSANSPAPQ